MLEQVYYLVIGIIGWITWQQKKRDTDSIPTEWSDAKSILYASGITVLCTVLLTYFVMNFHLWFPQIFLEPASYPFLDALTTAMSFVAMLLTTRRKIEGWVYWIIVDLIGVGLYWVKDVKFIAIQYVFLVGMAAYGLFYWLRHVTPDR